MNVCVWNARLVVLLPVALAVGPVMTGSPQETLPEGPGKAVTVRICGECHEADKAAAVRLTREGWEGVIGDMITQGAKGTDEEFQAILEYLATHFAGEAARAINLNSATSVELESVAGLLRKEAAALIEHREKKGPCKKLEDLKNVAGLDYQKIEDRKDRLVCM